MRTYYNLKSAIRYALAILVVSHLSLLTVSAQSEGGLLLGAEADKKINKQLSISLEAELRTRNNFKTMDRWAVGLGMQYKLTNWLKADAGYKLLNTNFREDIDLKSSGAYNHWCPSYWGVKHRFYASLAGSYKFSNNIKLELRERWQYTYRPEKTYSVGISKTHGGKIRRAQARPRTSYAHASKYPMTANVRFLRPLPA